MSLQMWVKFERNRRQVSSYFDKCILWICYSWMCHILQISSPSSISSSIDDESSVNEFLAKMDTSIANAKRDVKRSQGNSE